MPVNNEAWIYLLEDINDNRYVGSTGAPRLEDRLSTHKRDENEYNFGIRKGKGCSSMKLNLHNVIIKPLMKCENNWKQRKLWESHYINNVYPECVNDRRLNSDPKKKAKEYYHKNKEQINAKRRADYAALSNSNPEHKKNKIIKSSEWREKNKEKVNAKRREYYQKNKEKILKQKKILREYKRLENL